MLHYQTSIDINRPVDRVFEVMTQLDDLHQLMGEVEASRKTTDGPVGLGTRMTESVKLGPARADLTWEITAFEANRLCTFEGDTSIGRTKTSYIFEGIEGGSRVTAEVNVQLAGLYRLARPVVRFFHLRNRQRYLANIKKTLENGPNVENP